MLKIISTTNRVAQVPPVHPRKHPRPHLYVKATGLANSDRSQRELAHLAANWLLDSLTLIPSMKLAADVFGVSIPLIIQERKSLLETTIASPVINVVWDQTSTEVLDQFVSARRHELWNRFDRITASS
jgi:hypothetical protein